MGEVIEKIIVTVGNIPELKVSIYTRNDVDLLDIAGKVLVMFKNKGFHPNAEIVPSKLVQKELTDAEIIAEEKSA